MLYNHNYHNYIDLEDCSPAACEARMRSFICQIYELRNMTIPSSCIEYL